MIEGGSMKDMVQGLISEFEDIKEAIEDAGEKVDGSVEIDNTTLLRLFFAMGKAEAVMFALAFMKGGDKA